MATIRAKFKEQHGRWPTNHELRGWLATFVQPEVTVNEPKPKTRIKLVTVVPKYDCVLLGPSNEKIQLKAKEPTSVPERLVPELKTYEDARSKTEAFVEDHKSLLESKRQEAVLKARAAERAKREKERDDARRKMESAILEQQLAMQTNRFVEAAKQHLEPPKPLDPKEDPNSEFYDPLSVFKETGKLPESAAKVVKKWRLFEL